MVFANAGSAMWDLQVAVLDILKSDALLQNTFNGIYDGLADQDAAMPYVVVSEWFETPEDLLTREGRDVSCSLHVWSSYRGFKEVSFGVKRMIQLLSRQQFLLANWNLIVARMESAQVVMGDGEQRHGLVRMRFKVSPKS